MIRWITEVLRIWNSVSALDLDFGVLFRLGFAAVFMVDVEPNMHCSVRRVLSISPGGLRYCLYG